MKNPDTDLLKEYTLRENAQYFRGGSAGDVDIIPCLIPAGFRKDPGVPAGTSAVEFRIGITTKYLIKDIAAFLKRFERHVKYSYGKKLDFIHDVSALTPSGRTMYRFMERTVREYQIIRGQKTDVVSEGVGESGEPGEPMRTLPLSPQALEQFLECMDGAELQLSHNIPVKCKVKTEDPKLRVLFLQAEGSVRIYTEKFRYEEGADRLFVLQNDTLYCCSKAFTQDCTYFLKTVFEAQDEGIELQQGSIPVFVSSVLPVLKKYFRLQNAEIFDEYQPPEGHVRIHIDAEEHFLLSAKVETAYADRTYNAFDPVRVGKVYRNVRLESVAVHRVMEYFPHIDRKAGAFRIYTDEELYRFLDEGQTALREVGEVYLDRNALPFEIRKAPRLGAYLHYGGGILELSITAGDLPPEEVTRLLETYRQKKHYVRLKDGSFMRLREGTLALLNELADGLNLNSSDFAEGTIQLPLFRAPYLQAVLGESQNEIQVSRNEAFSNYVWKLQPAGPGGHSFSLPPETARYLRPYQRDAYQWMRTLDSLGLGGILADDMGLGKTIEAAALLEAYEYEEKEDPRPSLIVCPASLIYNWEAELKRFAPSVNCHVIGGPAAAREKEIQNALQIPRCVLITSYELLKRDYDIYKNTVFRYEILDEAQMIKNYMTQSARVVKKIRSQTRFALTGTPVENRLSELWSIFDYLMKGLLYNYSRFRDMLEVPITVKKDETAARRLRSMIRPFVLRRLKTDVLKDLPDKDEVKVYAAMQEEQRKLYDLQTSALREEIRGMDVSRNKLQILAQLMRLRQLCCDPSLIYENYTEGSAKTDTCIHLVSDAVGSNHKVLLFSQFTSMLEILKNRLDALGIASYMLTGSVSKEKRAELVRSFYLDETPVFLISLKAGGVGLNLTAADIVVLYDPWWNLAAEVQATDRAYRIGQQNKVTVYRLIAKDTIEDRILEMQEHKKDLSDQIITDGDFSGDYLSEESLAAILG
ncbi:MAG: DEAD/DEAH box helicase [Firmicutes bacterium]|nr:DEAD/DEAH box helicase [Bacillota bacterium]